MWSIISKAKKADRKLSAKIEDAIRAAKSAENVTEMTDDQIDGLSRKHYQPPGRVKPGKMKFQKVMEMRQGKFLGPEGAKNEDRVITPYHTILRED